MDKCPHIDLLFLPESFDYISAIYVAPLLFYSSGAAPLICLLYLQGIPNPSLLTSVVIEMASLMSCGIP